MVGGMDGPNSGVCVVCAKVVSSSLVNVHASLIAQNGSIHRQMGQVVGVEQLEEACRATEFVCSICLRLLLNIVNLECKVILLKDEFRATFLQGTQSRREVLAGGPVHLLGQCSLTDHKTDDGDSPQDEVWTRTHLDPCVKPEKVERFFSNIPLDTDNITQTFNTSKTAVDDRTQDVKSVVKHESPGCEMSTVTSKQSSQGLDTHLPLDTSAAQLSDLLPPHCLLGDDVNSFGSQGEEEALRDAIKRPINEPSTQQYSNSPSTTVTTMQATKPMQCGGEGEKTCTLGSPEEDKQDSDYLPDCGGGASCEDSEELTPHKRIRKHKGKEDQGTCNTKPQI